jgi:hypothetical protein
MQSAFFVCRRAVDGDTPLIGPAPLKSHHLKPAATGIVDGSRLFSRFTGILPPRSARRG